ncbi:glycosyltransferase family 4 protein [Cohnella algarum]|nr:glycosyltransferase family 4 protein [Cohnella algarum]
MDIVKVAFVTPGAYAVPSPRGGSVERVVEKVVPLLAPAIEARIYGRVRRGLPARERWRGAECVRYPASDKAAYAARVFRSLASYRPDLIQVENRPLFVRELRKRFPDKPIWLSLQSTTFISRPYLGPKTTRACLRLADRILVNSRYLASQVRARAPETADKISVVHLGVEPERFGLWNPEEERARRGWADRRIVLYVGRLIPLKGVHHLLAAMPELVRAVPNVLVVIVGGAFYGSSRRTAYVERLHKLAKPWKRHVHFQSYVSHTDIPRWFGLAHAVAVPSGEREAFGLVNVEAMASGLPVVAARSGGISEIVEDGVTGFLVDRQCLRSGLASRLSLLLQNESLREEMGRRGRERALSLFTWEHTAGRWLDEAKRAGILNGD